MGGKDKVMGGGWGRKIKYDKLLTLAFPLREKKYFLLLYSCCIVKESILLLIFRVFAY